MRGDVEAALAAGHSRKTIWEYLRANGHIECRYETFTQYIKRHLGEKKSDGDAKEKKANAGPTKVLPRKPSAESTGKSSEMSSFIYNAKPNPKEIL